jgi:hypothetical protein
LSTYLPKLRMYSSPGNPLYSGDNYQIGFYDAGVMRQVSETFNVDYKVWSIEIPSTEQEFNFVTRLIQSPKVLYSLLDKNKVVFVTVENDSPSNWMNYLNQLGYVVNQGSKTGKRLKSFHRPTLLNAHFDPQEIEVLYVNPEDYSVYDFDTEVVSAYRDLNVRKRLSDGVFIVSPYLIQSAIKSIPFTNNGESSKSYYYDEYIYERLVNDLLSQKAFNARLIFADGFLKGNCFVSDKLPEGVHVLTSEENVKSEISYTKGFRFLAEPQGPKNRVLTDDQTVINFPNLFPSEEMESWLDDLYSIMYNKLIDNKLLGNWKSIYQKSFRDNKTNSSLESISYSESNSRSIYTAYNWIASGHSLSDSPWLFQSVGISNAKPFESRVPIPCTLYEQIIPACVASIAGYNYDVQEGYILKSKELQAHIVNDIDWLEMYESHGGHDGDDFFKLFYRTMDGGEYDGEKVVIAIRSPNGFGEYSIFRYTEGSSFPTWDRKDGSKISFPVISGNNLPLRLSEAISSGQVNYIGLPSSSIVKMSSSKDSFYSPENVYQDIETAMSGGNVGGFVNAAMAHSFILKEHRKDQLCSLEDAIDKCIIPDSIQDVKAIDQESKSIMSEVFSSGRPFDELFYSSRGLKRFAPPGFDPEFSPGIITNIAILTTKAFNNYKNKVIEYSQENISPMPMVEVLGQRFASRAWYFLRKWRIDLYKIDSNENVSNSSSSDPFNHSVWNNVYSSVVDEILSYERIEDRYDFIIALYYTSFLKPTSSGRISDQVVMNRVVFPYLMEALYFYGISSMPIFVDNYGKKIKLLKTDNWFYEQNGNMLSFTNPYEYQKVHSKDSSY